MALDPDVKKLLAITNRRDFNEEMFIMEFFHMADVRDKQVFIDIILAAIRQAPFSLNRTTDPSAIAVYSTLIKMGEGIDGGVVD